MTNRLDSMWNRAQTAADGLTRLQAIELAQSCLSDMESDALESGCIELSDYLSESGDNYDSPEFLYDRVSDWHTCLLEDGLMELYGELDEKCTTALLALKRYLD